MSKDRKKLLHIHSSVNDKQPTPATLELGELGVNNAKGNAFISTKNSDGEVVRFSEDETIIGWMEQKEVFPYEGYVRGSDGNKGVTEQDLLNNKSNIIIKLNQVVPENTDYSPYDEKVNGAKDIYGNLINPISEGGYQDGAGLAIDMSQYVMQGANPSFSSVTTTCGALFQGTTEIEGLDGDCGSEFNVHVENVCIDANDILNEYGANESNFGVSCDKNYISNATTLKGEKILIDSPSGDSTVDIKACSHISGYTNNFVVEECQDGNGKVEIKTTDVDVSANTTDIKSCDRISLESKNIILTDGDCGNGEITIETNDLCLAGNEKINVYGDETNVGLDCDDEIVATNTNVYGKNILVSATTGSICEMSPNDATLYGAVKTNIGINCNDTATAETTTVKGGKVIVDASTTDLGLTSKRDIVESSERDIKITANDNICETAGNEASLYGVSVTRLGENCDGTTKTSQLELGGENICVDATDRASMYGANKSDLGINCSDNDRSTLTRVSGDTVNEGGNIVNTNAETSINETAPTITESASTSISETAPNITETASQNITETAEHDITETASHDINNTATNDIYVTAGNKLCENGKDSYFYGTNSTTIGKGCDDTLSSNITYWRNTEPVCDNGVVGFSATTVDGALDEVYYRSQVSMTSTGNTTGIDVPVPESGTSIVRSGSTTYTIHQDSDGCDKTYDFTVDNTIVSMSAYTYSAAEELAKKYTFWQYIGDTRVEIGEINIPKDHILKDASIVNGHLNGGTFTPCPAGDDTCHWYIKLVWNVFDPSTGHADDKITYLPADDFVKDLVVNNPTNNGVCLDIWYDGQKKNISAHTEAHMIHGNNSTDTKYTITDGCKHSLTSYTLNSVSGDVKTANAATNWTYDPFDKKVTITAATDVNHLNRKTVSWTYGDVKSAAGASYDPGDGEVNTTSNERSMEFIIPNSIDHLNKGSLTVTHNGFNNVFDLASDSVWSLPHSSLTITYGNTCGLQDTSLTYDTSENKNVIIPKTISDVTNGAMSYDCTSDCITVSKNICMDDYDVTAKGFYSKSDVNLKENINNLNFKDYSKVENVAFKSFNFKNDETKTKTYGVIAQEVQAAGLNEIVHKDNDGNLSVDYISLLILKIAELEDKVNKLSEELKNK